MKSVTLLLVSSLLAACQITVPSDGQAAPATPQRPTFSSNTKTTAERTFELESGLYIDWKDRFETPTKLKWGATESTEFFVELSPYVSVDTMGVDGSSIGDTLIGVRQRLQSVSDGEVSSAFQLVTKLPTADEDDIGTSGQLDLFAAGIVDIDLPGISWTGFGQVGFLGEAADEDVDLEWLFSGTGSIPIEDDLSAFGEAAVLYVPEQDVEALYFTLGSAYAYRPSTVFDASVRIGIGSDIPDFAVLIGFTQNLGRIGR